MNAAIGRLNLSISLNPPAERRNTAEPMAEADPEIDRARNQQIRHRQVDIDRIRWSEQAHWWPMR